MMWRDKCLSWAKENFGSIATSRKERAARLVEEALEVGQAEGLEEGVAALILARVYSRPIGQTRQEIGGLMLTIDALCENIDVSWDNAAQDEWDRVSSLPKDWWQRKHAEKTAAGTANL